MTKQISGCWRRQKDHKETFGSYGWYAYFLADVFTGV